MIKKRHSAEGSRRWLGIVAVLVFVFSLRVLSGIYLHYRDADIVSNDSFPGSHWNKMLGSNVIWKTRELRHSNGGIGLRCGISLQTGGLGGLELDNTKFYERNSAAVYSKSLNTDRTYRTCNGPVVAEFFGRTPGPLPPRG